MDSLVKSCMRFAYAVMRAVLYPAVAVLKIAVPAFRDSPHFAVAGVTIAVFAALSSIARWASGSASFGILFWAMGITMAYGFSRWGGEFERKGTERLPSSAWRGRDGRVFLGVVPAVLLTLMAAQKFPSDGYQIAMALLLVITWLFMMVRYSYRPLGAFTILLTILWLAAAVGLYASISGLALAIQTPERFGALAIVCLLALIFIDYLVLPARPTRRLVRGMVCLGIVACVILLEANVLVPTLAAAAEAVVVLGTLLLAVSYWMVLAGKQTPS